MGRNWSPKYRCICRDCGWKGERTRRIMLNRCPRCRQFSIAQTEGWGKNTERLPAEHMRYLGTLGLLGECAVYVPEDLREQIIAAFTDAANAQPGVLKWRRVLNRLEIEITQAPQ